MFEKALTETREIQQAIYQAYFSKCGKECGELVDEGILRNAQEFFADWLAAKSLPRHLNRENDQNKKREAIDLTLMSFCSDPIITENENFAFSEIEKRFSFETHPDHRIRRLSLITPETAKIISCTIDEETKRGFGACDF